MAITTITVRISDGYGNPANDVQLLVKADGQLVKKIDHANGTTTIPLTFGLYQLGEHTIQAEVEGNAFYEGSSGSAQLKVTSPVWFYGFVAFVLIVSSAAYFVIRTRKKPLVVRNMLLS